MGGEGGVGGESRWRGTVGNGEGEWERDGRGMFGGVVVWDWGVGVGEWRVGKVESWGGGWDRGGTGRVGGGNVKGVGRETGSGWRWKWWGVVGRGREWEGEG